MNQLEQLIRNLGWRTNVIGIFPKTVTVVRRADALMLEHYEEWTATPRAHLYTKRPGSTAANYRRHKRQEPSLS